MKKYIGCLCLLLCACLLLGSACVAEGDYADQLKLNPLSPTAKTQATVKNFVDGDTVHFHVPEDVIGKDILKARFLAVNTPEISGKVEEWGKRAADFTKEKLSRATSILLESDDEGWNLDSTGDRHLVWVWYRTDENSDYRCLNIELLQNGLAKPNSTANNRYGTVATTALEDARTQKLCIFSGQRDPDFYYGEAIEMTLRELRLHAEEYTGKKVAFSGIVTLNDGNSVYVEDLDEETGCLFGMSVYYGYNLSGKGLSILSPGNEVRIVGTMQYYEAGKTYQVSDLNYHMMKPKDPENIQKLSEGHTPAYKLTDARAFAEGTITVDGESYPLCQAALSTSISLNGLTVTDVQRWEDSASMTVECVVQDTPIRIRLVEAKDVNIQVGDEISVRGIVDYYEDMYQVKAFGKNAITP